MNADRVPEPSFTKDASPEVDSSRKEQASPERTQVDERSPKQHNQTPKAGANGSGWGGFTWTIINFWLDAALAVQFLAALWTAFVTRFVFPPPTSAAGWTLWGFTYNQWSELTFVLLCGFGLGVLVHVMLHWSWVCGVAASKLLAWKRGPRRALEDGERTLLGVGLVVVILNVLGGALAYATLTVQGP